MHTMNSKMKTSLIITIIILFLAGIFTISFFLGRIPENDISVRGNTAGNLNNGGLFCESEGKVYFSNAYDDGSLYSMNTDETQMKKLNNTPTFSINAGGNYLYYCMNSTANGDGLGYIIRTVGLYRTKKNGKDTICLKKDPVVTAQLCGNYIYYQNYNNKESTKFYKVKIDKEEDVLVSNMVINPASYDNGIIYFNGMDKNHYLYTLNTATDDIAVLLSQDVWNPVYQSGYLYFMDIHENYRLCRYSLTDHTIEVLTSDRVDYFNIGDHYIYYQKSDPNSPALKRMFLDGSEPEIIAEGNYENINITSEYVYFNEFGHSLPVCRTPAYGVINVTYFDAAAAAAEELKATKK